MAEVKQASTTTEQELGAAADRSKEVAAVKKANSPLSSTASTVSGTNSESASDSDASSSKASKKKESTTLSDEPMKVQVPSYLNTNHPAIENILTVQKLQSQLEDALYQRLKQEALLAAAAEAEATHAAFIQQQHEYMQGYDAAVMGYPQMGYPYGDSPLVPYLLAELADGTPPMPGYLPGYMDVAAHWPVPPPMPHGAMQNKQTKHATAAKNSAKSIQSVAKAPSPTAAANAPKDNDDAKNAVSRTVVATKINRLGFSAERILKDYFGQFGNIDNVCVPQKVKRVQGNASAPAHGHLRPSGLGFIVMETEEEAKAILAAGTDHEVCGKLINVRAFKEGQNDNATADQED